MGRVTSARPHLSKSEVSKRLKETTGREHRRWLVVWNALADPRPAKEIATHTGVSVSTVHNVISRYNRFGPKAIESAESGKRRRCYLSKEEESKFMQPFLKHGSKGDTGVAAGVKKALEELLGHKVHHSTVYRMIQRNSRR